jgi:hypothetical protein
MTDSTTFSRPEAPATINAVVPQRIGLLRGRPKPAVVERYNDDALFALFFGPNAEMYLATLDALDIKNVNLSRPVRSWSWPAFLLTLPWLLYRKLWLAAAATVVLPLLFFYFVPAKSGIPLFVYIIIAMYAKSIYVQSAAAQIRRITAENKDPEVVRDKIRRAGGVSIAGGAIGGIIQFLGLAAVIFSTFLARKYGLR